MKRILLIAGFISAFVSLITHADPVISTDNVVLAQNLTPAQVKQFQQVIHDYLLQNPEVLIEASKILREREDARTLAAAKKAIVETKEQIFNDPASPIAGNKTGTILLTEFFDYQCPHCKTMGSDIQSLITSNPNLKVIFKELPIFGAHSQFAAQAALAAAKQNKYLPFHEALLSTENPLTDEKIFTIAKKLGLDVDQLKKDMDAPDVKKQLLDNFKLANQLSIPGTPTFVLSDKNYAQFKYIPGQTTQEDLQKKINELMVKPKEQS